MDEISADKSVFQSEKVTWSIDIDTRVFSIAIDKEKRDPLEEDTFLLSQKRNLEFVLHLSRAFLKQSYTDVTFLIENQEIHAHKYDLVISYIDSVSEGEGASKDLSSSKIKIEDISLNTFKALLGFIYSNQVEFTESLALELLEFSEKYSFTELKSVSEEYLGRELNLNCLLKFTEAEEKFMTSNLSKEILESVIAHKELIEGKQESFSFYIECFNLKAKLVGEITNILNTAKNRAGVENFEQIPELQLLIKEVRPMINIRFTNQIGSVLRTADVVVTQLTQYQNNRVVYYGLLEYIAQNIMKNIESYYQKGQKLSLYYRLALVLLVDKKVPGFVEYFFMKIGKEVPILAGKEAKKQPGMSEADFLRLKGYKVSDNSPEEYEFYDKRLNAYTYFFFMMMTLRLEDVKNDLPPDEFGDDIRQIIESAFKTSLRYDWMYWSFIKLFLKAPIQLYSAHVMIGFYFSSAYAIRRQPERVRILMKLIFLKYLPELEKFAQGIKNKSEREDLLDNKLLFLRNQLQKFNNPRDPAGMAIMTPIEEARREEFRVEDD